MNPVNILIFNALARRESVNLPGVGTLHVIFRPAMINSQGNTLNPPMNRVEISGNESAEGVNIVDLIMQSSSKDKDTSRRIYDKWLEEVTAQDGTINIESVGEIKSDFLTMAPEISATLNPAGTKSVTVKKQNNSTLIISIIVAILVGAAISMAIITYLERDTDKPRPFPAATPQQSAPATRSDAPSPQDEAAASSTQNTEQAEASVEPSAVSPNATQTSPQATAAQPAAAGTTLYYVVIGTYSTDSNAERFIAEAKALDGNLTYNKLPLRNGKIMIYTTSHATEAEARANRRLTAFPEAWVFKYKK